MAQKCAMAVAVSAARVAQGIKEKSHAHRKSNLRHPLFAVVKEVQALPQGGRVR
jgi:hypothetical protein